jgi:hypothetical protein
MNIRRHQYAYEKFSTAVAYMATSPAPIQDRILLAYGSFHPVTSSDFASDPDLRSAFDEIMGLLRADKSDPVQGYVPITVRGMSEEEAAKVADLIVDFAALLR